MTSPMRIERIECVPLTMPLPRTFRGSNYFMTHRCTIITRIYTSEGIVGEIYNGDDFETQGEVVKIILDEIQPLLIGRDAFNIEGCWQAMLKPSYNILRDRKLAMSAQACVDSALWDAVGKALNAPSTKSGAVTPIDCSRFASPAIMKKARRSPILVARWRKSRPRAMPGASSRWAARRLGKMPSECGWPGRPQAMISY